ncbi:LysR family transcriptional regulator [Rahnella woolbedingensis]|uniref:LysR family transcriptional regulator n=1 Tax=Rahnella woolbedingensis TaxID=1510574 RepID=A0A419N2N7_9GAMM|nr:LysR family transcriptional regulator [Rahnella woolbedingensis]RJT35144.1 LysR family transcriptional regulator [Rahnella woolbedingensis]
MKAPSLHLVQTFVAVVEHHSFARAASALGITPSSVSRFIKTLEQALGTTLLNRTTRAMSLTETGKRYYVECHQALLQLNQAAVRVRDEQTLPSGPLVVSAPVAFGHTHIVPHLRGFLAVCPQVQLDLRLTDDYADLVTEGIMLAFRIGRMKDSSLIAHKMLDNRRILVAAPSYLEEHGTPSAPEDLHQHDCIVSSASHDGVLWRLFFKVEELKVEEPNAEERTLAPKGSVKVDNADAARRLCIDGQGIAFHSAVTMAAAITAGDLVQILPQWTGRETGVYCVRPNRHMGPAAKAFLDFLAARWQCK